MARAERERLRTAVEATGADFAAADADTAFRLAVMRTLHEVARGGLAGMAEPSLDGLSAAYECLLAYRPQLDPHSGRLVLRPNRHLRRSTGSFYTPRPVARMVVEAALKPLLGGGGLKAPGGSPASLRILDPAMGTGVFLAEAARYLAAHCGHSPGWIAEHCLSGIDQDPLAVEIGVLALARETGARAHVLRRHLRQGDAFECYGGPAPAAGADGNRQARRGGAPAPPSAAAARPAASGHHRGSRASREGGAGAPPLRHTSAYGARSGEGPPRLWEDGAFDAVVGNPPWGVKYGPDEEARLRDRLGLGPGVADSFKLFLALGSRLSRGTVSMIVPGAVLRQEGHADIRRLLLDRLDPYLVAELDDEVFPDAAAPACALVFGPKPGPRSIPVATPHGAGTRPPAIPATRWSAGGFPIGGHETLDLLARLQRSHPTLGELRDLFRVRDTGLNYNRASVARRVMYCSDTPEDPRDLPRYRGRDFARYTDIRRSGWLRHDAADLLELGDRLTYGERTRGLAEKIVIRQTADRIVATLDRSRMVMGRSVIAITKEGEASLLGLLACLNSRLVTELYRALAGEEGRLLPQVKVGRLLALPLPIGAVASEGWRELELLSRRMLETGGQDAGLDARIDELVEALYEVEGSLGKRGVTAADRPGALREPAHRT